ncbi:carbonic anhydrase 1-like [Panonychus citri]|uniref:carbonic anhydrase 1-like n=1 Tax=Panonychus citri TaxID=50023 RepID=UPI00230765B1|nr:carbonic anhydrase 1-like [Panonychus citri]
MSLTMIFDQFKMIFLIIVTSTLINQLESTAISFQQLSDHIIDKRAADYHDWTYEDQKAWVTNITHCGGDKQSPINLDSSKARVDKTLTLDIKKYDRLIDTAFVYSTGHSLKLEFESRGVYLLSGTVVDRPYELLQVHIHWGINSMSGSEHSIDGERFSAEVHFVHRNTKYANESSYSVLQKVDGLTVLGVIAKNGDPNPGVDILLEAMQSNSSDIKYPVKKPFDLNHLLPSNKKSFFKYSGSLTTPTCNEVVNWIVMKDFITVSNDQIDRLRNLISPSETVMQTVVRDLQPLQGRTVFQSDSGSGFAPTLTSLCYLILAVIVHITLIDKLNLD